MTDGSLVVVVEVEEQAQGVEKLVVQHQVIQRRPARLKIGPAPSGQPHSEPSIMASSRSDSFIVGQPLVAPGWR